jgi:alcohol dehydrogenase YqhD (iron-dependent ADH family)
MRVVQEKGAVVMPQFATHFKGVELKKGTEVKLVLAQGGDVSSIVNGEKVRMLALTLTDALRTCTASQ